MERIPVKLTLEQWFLVRSAIHSKWMDMENEDGEEKKELIEIEAEIMLQMLQSQQP